MKDYILQFTLGGMEDFLSLPKAIQKRIRSKMEFFIRAANPMHFAKKLRGEPNIFRFRIGDYRVITTTKEKDILVILLILKIGHRRDVYE